MTTTTCPDNETFVLLLLGKIRGPEREALEQHLETCNLCAENAETLAIDDELTAIIKSDAASQIGATAFTDDDESAVNKLIQRIKSARQQIETVQVEETLAAPIGEMPQSLPSALGGLSANDTSFLAPAQLPDEIGRLGDYRVLEVLGMGGMGMVFRAEDPRLKRQVALKTMKPTIAASRDSKGRFLREAQATAALEHDNVVPIYAVGEDRGIPFIAMQYLKGESLKDRLDRDTRLTPLMVVRLGKEIASGLAAAHEQGLIHRDIKPDNIWLDEKFDRAKILDFGLVSATSEDEGLTQSGTVLGTPRYMAPEQALAHPVDHRCDLFSLGSVLYHAASGKAPFAGSNFTSTLIAVAHQPAAPLRSVAPELHGDVAKAIMQLLEKDPEKRPQSATNVAERFAELERLLKRLSAKGSADEALSDTVTYNHVPVGALAPPRKPPVTRKLLLAGAGGLAALMLGVLVITIRDKDGKESIVRVPTGTELEVDAAPGSKVTIREENLATSEQPTAEKNATSEASPMRVAKENSRLKGELEKSVQPVVTVGAQTPLAFETPGFDQWIKAVSALPAEQQVEAVSKKLMELNPGFDGKIRGFATDEMPGIENGEVVSLGFWTDNVVDISPVRALIRLRALDCNFSWAVKTKLTDLSPLRGMPLTQLAIAGCPVSDLSPLQGMPLWYFNCTHSNVTDFTPLHGMPLTELRCGYPQGNFPGNDELAALKDLPLHLLELSQWGVSDLTPLKDMPLDTLDLYNTPVSDLSPLRMLPLISLNVKQTLVSDLSPIKDLPLIELGCDFNPNMDATFLRSIKTLERIAGKPKDEYCDQVEAYQAAAKRPRAFETTGFDQWLSETSALTAEDQLKAVASKLQELNPGFDGKFIDRIENGTVTGYELVTNHVTDISPVRAFLQLRSLKCTFPGRSQSMVGGLSDLSPLRGLPLTWLATDYNPISDLSPLINLPLIGLNCDIKSAWDTTILRSIKTLETINDKPVAEFWKEVDAEAVAK
jgi:Leucine-rich repeat (LRR) protein